MAYDEYIRSIEPDGRFWPADGDACARNSRFDYQQDKKVKHHSCLAASGVLISLIS